MTRAMRQINSESFSSGVAGFSGNGFIAWQYLFAGTTIAFFVIARP